MAVTPQIRATQAGVSVASGGTAYQITSTQARMLVPLNYPTNFVQATDGKGAVVSVPKVDIEVTQARMMVLTKGRIANPKLRVWTFTLDGHDFYVLRLGDDTTLLYDLASEQWVEWTYDSLPFWRPNTGMTWIGSEALAHTLGSSVVVGDDTYGLLWFLDPEQAFDEHPDYLNPAQQIPFTRIVTGQVLASGRQNIPCYAIFLEGDNYGLTAEDFVPSVTLETSDDQGRTFDKHDTLTVTPDYDQDNAYTWPSLGQISSPGRIFRVTDNGVFARIDSMGMNDDAG